MVMSYANHIIKITTKNHLGRDKNITAKKLLFRRRFLSMPPPPWFLVGIKASNLKKTTTTLHGYKQTFIILLVSCF